MLDAANQPASELEFVYDVLICPAGGPAGPELAPSPFSAFAGRVSVAAGTKAVSAWWRAVAEAAQARRHLLVILGPLTFWREVVPPLLRALERDPLFGTAQPRFSDPATDLIWPLPPSSPPLTTRASLKLLPETLITAEILCACTLIRREVVSTIQRDNDSATVPAALAHALSRARRLGYRNVVVNRAVIPSSLAAGALYPALPRAEADKLRSRFPETDRVALENERLPQRSLEPLLSAAHPAYRSYRRLLLDCRALGPVHNGTSQCMLGILDGFAALEPNWEIHVQSNADAAAFHTLDQRYPTFTHHIGHEFTSHYGAILVLNQPWAVETIADLHRHALLIGFTILDTIGWDVIYPAPEGLERGFRFASRHVDILTYISAFSRDRFRQRFRVADRVAEDVIHLSLAPDEQALPELMNQPTAEHVLLFGNSYDHKGVDPAIRLLASAFPLQKFVVLGAKTAPAGNVHAVPSGSATREEIHRLIATARAIVYPSFYEGFGLPVVEGLAYGRTVLARSCTLWTEIASHARLDGRLIEFDDDRSMMERLAEILAGNAAPGLRFGTALGAGQPVCGWRDAAAAYVAIVERKLRTVQLEPWFDRAEALTQARV